MRQLPRPYCTSNAEVREIISSAEKVLVPAIVLGEVQLGINNTKRGRTTQKALEKFLDQPFV